MIIRSKDKVNVNGKNKPVWVLDTATLTVTHNTSDAEPSVTTFSSDHIKYHLHYSAEYRPARLKKLVNDGTVLSYLTELDRSVAEAIERQVELWKQTDSCYQEAVLAADAEKMLGLENCFISMAREAVFECMVYI